MEGVNRNPFFNPLRTFGSRFQKINKKQPKQCLSLVRTSCNGYKIGDRIKLKNIGICKRTMQFVHGHNCGYTNMIVGDCS